MRNNIIKYVIVLLLVCAAVYVGLDIRGRISQEQLWGWRPFFLLITGWVAVILLFTRRSPKLKGAHRFLLLSCLSGVLLSVAFPPSPLTPLIFVGLVPLLIVENELYLIRRGTARWHVFKYAFNTFFIWNICTTWWVLNTAFLPGIAASLVNALLMATVFLLYHQVRAVLQDRLQVVILTAFWIAFEYLHLHWEISWPWLTFGHTFAEYPSWVQWYEYTGVFGGSLWVLVVNFLAWKAWTLFRASRRIDSRQLAVLAAVVLLPVLAGVIRYATYPLEEGTVEVVVVQPNFEPHYEKFNFSQSVQLKRFLTLSRQAVTDQTDYLVYPETSLGYIRLNDIEEDYRIDTLRQMLEAYPGLHLVMGIESFRVHDDPPDLPSIRPDTRYGDTIWYDVQNSAIQIAQDQDIEPYFKSKLVPGAEHYPFRDVLPFLEPLFKMLQGSVAGMTTQDRRSVFPSDLTSVAPVICYESVYGAYVGEYVVRGAGIIFIITNDGWWDDTPGHVQHLKFGALRAIEHRRPIARSANTGISCFINARGDILQPTAYGETTAIKGKVAPGEGYTFYTRWGDLIARMAVYLTLILIVLAVVRMIGKRMGATV